MLPPFARPVPPDEAAGNVRVSLTVVRKRQREQLLHLVLRVFGGARRQMPLVLRRRDRERHHRHQPGHERDQDRARDQHFDQASCPVRRAAASLLSSRTASTSQLVRHVRMNPVAATVMPYTNVPSRDVQRVIAGRTPGLSTTGMPRELNRCTPCSRIDGWRTRRVVCRRSPDRSRSGCSTAACRRCPYPNDTVDDSVVGAGFSRPRVWPSCRRSARRDVLRRQIDEQARLRELRGGTHFRHREGVGDVSRVAADADVPHGVAAHGHGHRGEHGHDGEHEQSSRSAKTRAQR